MDIDQNKVRELYNNMSDIWPASDLWYTYTHKQVIQYIDSFQKKYPIYPHSKVVNIGSAGNEYNLPGIHYHIDIAEERIKHCARYFVGSAEKLPYPNEFFDTGLCVGSVINYCDPMQVLAEISRVLKHDSVLVLDFEQSRSYQFIGKSYNTNAKIIKSFNSGNEDLIWVFSENHIRALCKLYGLDVIDIYYYHLLTPLIYRICKNEQFAARFYFMDCILRKIPIIRKISCNIILLIYKS